MPSKDPMPSSGFPAPRSSLPAPSPLPAPPSPLLSVRGLCKYFPIFSKGFLRKRIGIVKAADDINFDLMPGETLGLVGESGCGKTTTGRSILRALAPTSGEVLFRVAGSEERGAREGRGGEEQGAKEEAKSEGGDDHSVPRSSLPATRSSPPTVDLTKLTEAELKPLRTQMQMIFQDPFSSLNPRMTVRDIVGEPLVIHRMAKGLELEDRVSEMLRMVGLKPEHRTRYPHAFSGGQRQRIGIARALIMHPSLVVCDEAVSALDVSVQAQVINLLQDLQRDLGLTYIFIAHDLSVVKHICDRIAVMYAGRIVELAPTAELFAEPKHPYTKALLSAVPNPDPDSKMEFGLKGEVADPGNLPPGCAFHPRCPLAEETCRRQVPELRQTDPERLTSCHLLAARDKTDW